MVRTETLWGVIFDNFQSRAWIDDPNVRNVACQDHLADIGTLKQLLNQWLDERVLTVAHYRDNDQVAGRDNTVRYNGLVLQIPASRDRYHFVKATIRVLEYHDGCIALFHGPRKIARFRADGSLDEGEAVRKRSVA